MSVRKLGLNVEMRLETLTGVDIYSEAFFAVFEKTSSPGYSWLFSKMHNKAVKHRALCALYLASRGRLRQR